MSLYSEILEQPERIEHLLTSGRKTAEQIAKAIRWRDIHYVFLAARGTSDNAGRYANYLWGAMNRIPIALATPSLFTYYQRPPRLNHAFVVGISQSGQSPDIVRVLEEGRQQDCPTLAITNVPESPLARAADFVMDIQAGLELAVAATKTFTAELMSIAMLSVAMSASEPDWKELEHVGGWIRDVLTQHKAFEQAAQRYQHMKQCVVLGRGYNYATAFEWALKLKELSYIVAEPYSSADFQHGPIAMLEHGFPILAVAAKGKLSGTLINVLGQLRNRFAIELVVISNDPEALELAQMPLTIPDSVPEWLSPLVAIVPAQLFSFYLSIAKGHDPDEPRSIHKVTETL
jgi:glucosamine--fructose-6-phosphate aminotransferase (isomerizing)